MRTGVTAQEFAAMCARYKRPGMSSRIPYESIRPFLNRLCELGFMERREQYGTSVYYPTKALREWVSWLQD